MGAYTIEQLNEAKANVTDQTPPKTVALIDKLIAELEDPSWGDLPGNIWPSVKQAGTEAWDALTDPIGTVSNMKDLWSGAMRQTSPMNRFAFEQLDKTGFTSPEDEQVADAAGGYLKERFSNPKKTMIEDPFGAALDAGSVLTGGASLAPKASMLANVGNKVAGFTDLPGQLLHGIRKLTPSMSPEKIYSSTAKFSTTMSPDKRKKMVQTALDEQILPTEAGLDKLNSQIDASLERVEGSINKATLSGAEIPKEDLLRSVMEYQDSLDPVTYGSDYQKVFDQVDDVITKQIELWEDVDMLTPDQVQKFKKELGKKINFSASARQFGGDYKPGTEQANVNIRSDAQHSLEQLDPNIKKENKRASNLISLREDGLTRAAGRIDNRDNISLGTTMKTAAGTSAGGPLGGAAALAFDLATKPTMNAQRALWMHRQGKNIDKGKAALGRLGDDKLPEGLMEMIRKLPEAAKYLDENGRLTAAGRQMMLEVEKITNEGEEAQIKGVLAQ